MIKFNVPHDGYRYFREIERLPEIGDSYDGMKVVEINEVKMDNEQPYDNNFNYNLYEIACEEEDVSTIKWCMKWYVCIRKKIKKKNIYDRRKALRSFFLQKIKRKEASDTWHWRQLRAVHRI